MKTMYSVHAVYKQCTIILHTVHDNLHEFPHVLFFMYFLHVCLSWMGFFSCNIIACLNLWQIYMYHETCIHEILKHVYCCQKIIKLLHSPACVSDGQNPLYTLLNPKSDPCCNSKCFFLPTLWCVQCPTDGFHI